ncbi:adenosine receptor A2b-like isoform X2 [Stylophora pistillata]|nr:adenosine receptor A2b-like isoform X2 [Stylophora pistillata]
MDINKVPYFNESENATARSDHLREVNNQLQTNNTGVAKLMSIATVIVVINSLVLYLVFKNKSLRTVPNYPLFSLAACDLFCGFVAIPLFTMIFFTPLVQSQGATRFYLGFLVTVLHNFIAIATVYHIVIVTGERYMAIKFPLKHRVIDQKNVLTLLAIVWISSFFISCIPFTWINKIYPVYKPVSLRLALGFTIFCMVFVLVLPYIFLIYAFTDMFKGVYGKPRSTNRCINDSRMALRRSRSIEKHSGSELKCLTLFVIMASVFLICWLPWFVIFLLYQLSFDISKLLIPSQMALLIRYMTSVVNPLLYTFLKRDFFQALKFTFRRRRQVSHSVIYPNGHETLQTEFNYQSGVSVTHSRDCQSKEVNLGTIQEG